MQLSRYLDRSVRVNAELLGIAAREAKSDIAFSLTIIDTDLVRVCMYVRVSV